MDQRLRILFVTAEVTPFARTGGLGDVAGTLPRELAALGHDVRVVMPLYQTIRDQEFSLTPLLSELPVPLAFGNRTARVWQGQLDEPGNTTSARPPVPVYFIEHDPYFQRPELYGDENGDYPDNAFRFLFFCRATLALPTGLQWFPQVFHCHDWHTGFVPAYLRFLPDLDARITSATTLFTIHNLAYQGVFPAWVFGLTGLPLSLFQPAEVEFFGGVNFMKAGLRYADRITTVSPTYAEEICTPEGGFGLDGVLRERREALVGILNGADYQAWNPATDPHIAARYDSTDISGKAACKTALLHTYNLPTDPETLLIGSITRLVGQKGMDVLAAAIDRLLTLDCSFVLLGSGDAQYERFFTDLARTYPQRVGVQLGFDDALAHQIQAGSDCLLMPSHYEPCGLTQLYSLRYGTVPIVHAVGGLEDTVTPYNPVNGQGTGFVFEEATAEALFAAVQTAMTVFRDREAWQRLIDNAMAQDFSWRRSVVQYLNLYRQTLESRQTSAAPTITFGTSGWRALVAEEFTQGRVATLSRAVVDHLLAEQADAPHFPHLLIAHDTRFLGREFAETVASTCTAAGAQVTVATTPLPTPVVSFEILRRRLDGAINITASHNPYRWNGVKFSPAWGGPALPETTRAIAQRANALLANGGVARLGADEARPLGLWVDEEVGDAYRAALAQLIDVDCIRRSGMTVAVDLLWGTAAGFLDHLLQEWGVLGQVFHGDRDPYFGGGRPEPVPESMAEMIALLRRGEHVLGVGCDCDADRFGICDRDGTFFVPNLILPLLLDYLVTYRHFTGKVGRSVATSHLLDAAARHHGLELVETPVGFKYLGEMIARDELLIGGEESGGLSIRGHVPEKDGILACLLAVEMVTRTGKSLRALLDDLFQRVGPLYPARQDVHLTPRQQECLKGVLAAPPSELAGLTVERVVTVDGLKLYLQGGSWLLVRASGTEPVARLYAEAGEERTTTMLLAEAQRVFFE